jgi:hypothetical protein
VAATIDIVKALATAPMIAVAELTQADDSKNNSLKLVLFLFFFII